MSTHDFDALVNVTVTVNDPSVFERGSDPEWASHYYGPMDQQQMLRHFAWNCVVNRYWDASHLDGWADLEPGAVTMDFDRSADIL